MIMNYYNIQGTHVHNISPNSLGSLQPAKGEQHSCHNCLSRKQRDPPDSKPTLCQFQNIRSYKYFVHVSGLCFFFSGLCGGPLASPTGHFASPNYPRYYPNNAYCEWKIHVPLGSVLKIDFLFFKTEEW